MTDKKKTTNSAFSQQQRAQINDTCERVQNAININNSALLGQESEELEKAAMKEAHKRYRDCPPLNIGGDYEFAEYHGEERELFVEGAQWGANWQKNQTINKACEWLRRCVDVDDEVKMINGEPEAESFIQKNIHRIKVANQIVEDFKKAMEDK